MGGPHVLHAYATYLHFDCGSEWSGGHQLFPEVFSCPLDPVDESDSGDFKLCVVVATLEHVFVGGGESKS